MTCDPNPITTPILLAIALFAYCWRNGTALGWYRGCGRDDLRIQRGSLHDVSTATKGD